MADVNVTDTTTIDFTGLNEIPQPFQTSGTNTLEIKPLEIKPLKTESSLDIKPLKTESSASIDLKPIVLDLCLTLNIGKVPSLCIRQPYRHEISWKVLNIDVFSICFSGEQETVVEELSPRPQVARGDVAWPPVPRSETTVIEPRAAGGSGLRIRLGP